MAEPTDSSLAFFTKGTVKQWAFVYELRAAAIRAKADQRSSKKGGPEEFIKLDTWYREKLPQMITGRKDFHVLYDELVQIAKWRLMMGKYRPKMLDLVRINTETATTGVTRKAFKKISHGKNLQQAITMLVNLKGIGPSTASAILSAAFPDEAPFMSDEGMQSTPGVEANDSTIAEYMNYSDQLRNKTEWLKQRDPDFKWTVHKVDQALWIYYVVRDYKPELLDSMPRVDESDLNISSSTVVAPELADDNANDCTSSNEAVSTVISATNGIHHHDSNSESASVPYSEEEFSQGGEASCSSSVAAADSNNGVLNLSNGHNNYNSNSSNHSLADEHHLLTSPVIATIPTSTTSFSPDEEVHVNGSIAAVPVEVTEAAEAEPLVVHTNGTKRPLGGSTNCLNSSTNSSGVGEDSCSQENGIDSEDSHGDGGLMMMTPSEENSIDGACSAEDLSQDQPPLKKQKTVAALELSSALVTASATAEE